jgi:hypothetical protein
MLGLSWLRHLLSFDWLAYILNFTWLQGVSPAVAKTVFLILFAVVGVVVLMIPREYIYESVESPRWWHNLKLWSLGVLAIIFSIYFIF